MKSKDKNKLEKINNNCDEIENESHHYAEKQLTLNKIKKSKQKDISHHHEHMYDNLSFHQYNKTQNTDYKSNNEFQSILNNNIVNIKEYNNENNKINNITSTENKYLALYDNVEYENEYLN